MPYTHTVWGLWCNRVRDCGCAYLEMVFTSLSIPMCSRKLPGKTNLLKQIYFWGTLPEDAKRCGRKKSETSSAKEEVEAAGSSQEGTEVEVAFRLTLSAPRGVLSDARKSYCSTEPREILNPSGELPFLIPSVGMEAFLHLN